MSPKSGTFGLNTGSYDSPRSIQELQNQVPKSKNTDRNKPKTIEDILNRQLANTDQHKLTNELRNIENLLHGVGLPEQELNPAKAKDEKILLEV